MSPDLVTPPELAVPRAYYFGCWGGVGHYLFGPGGRYPQEARSVLPRALQERQLDGAYYGDPALAMHERGGGVRWVVVSFEKDWPALATLSRARARL